MAAFKTCGHKTCVFNFFFFFFFIFLTMAVCKKHGSRLPKGAFYRCGFKVSLKSRV